MPTEENDRRFIAHPKSLAEREDRGALAALRRGLGAPPGTCAEMYPHVVPFLPEERWTWDEQRFYVVAALFAAHPASAAEGNLGDTLREVASSAGGDSTEKRFVALLKCHRDDLFDHLRQAVSLARSKDVPVNWAQLLRDLRHWDKEGRRVQHEWARSFWRAERAAGESTEAPVEGEER